MTNPHKLKRDPEAWLAAEVHAILGPSGADYSLEPVTAYAMLGGVIADLRARVAELEAALRECQIDLDVLEDARDNCGEWGAECPLQDWGAPGCIGEKSLAMARAALAPPTEGDA